MERMANPPRWRSGRLKVTPSSPFVTPLHFSGHGKGEHLEGRSDEGEVSAFEANGKDPDHGGGYDTAEGRKEKRQQKGGVRIVPQDQSHNVRADAE